MAKTGKKRNLYKQDYTSIEAIVTSDGGRLFFGGVFNGVLNEFLYNQPDQIVIGKIRAELAESISIHGFSMTSGQLRNAHFATNFSPDDIARGLWLDVNELAPEMLKDFVIKSADIRERIKLALGNERPGKTWK